MKLDNTLASQFSFNQRQALQHTKMLLQGSYHMFEKGKVGSNSQVWLNLVFPVLSFVRETLSFYAFNRSLGKLVNMFSIQHRIIALVYYSGKMHISSRFLIRAQLLEFSILRLCRSLVFLHILFQIRTCHPITLR